MSESLSLVTSTLGPGVSRRHSPSIDSPNPDATCAGKVRPVGLRVSASSLLWSAASLFCVSRQTSPGPPTSAEPRRSFVFSALRPRSLDLWFSRCCPPAETVPQATPSVPFRVRHFVIVSNKLRRCFFLLSFLSVYILFRRRPFFRVLVVVRLPHSHQLHRVF